MTTAVADNPLSVQALCDLAIEVNLVPDDMFFSWDVFGGWQRDVCRHFGGPRDWHVLDIGCGPLRFGAHVLTDIGNGHFYGIEPFAPYLDIGRRIAERLGAADKVTLIASDSVKIPEGLHIDFAMCHAVFTHMSFHQITNCLERVARVMKPGGRFVMTYNLNRKGEVIHRGRLYAEQMPLISAHLPGTGVLEEFCSARGLTFEPFNAVPHPGQSCGVITF